MDRLQNAHDSLDRLYQAIGGKLAAMINRADDFCKNASDHSYVHEARVSYGLEEL